MPDGKKWVFWRMGLLSKEFPYNANVINKRLLQSDEIDLLNEVLSLEIPSVSRCYVNFVKDCGSTSLYIFRDGEVYKMEGQRVLTEKWKSFAGFANTVADNCGNKEKHNHILYINQETEAEIVTPSNT